MCDADNHAVREAGCQGVAELAQKVGSNPLYAEYLSPYVTMLLQVCLCLSAIVMFHFYSAVSLFTFFYRHYSCAFMTSHGQ